MTNPGADSQAPGTNPLQRPVEPAGAPGTEPAKRPEVEAVEVNARPVILAGTIGWLIALVLLATVFHAALARHHATFWLWSCGIGAVLGLYGVRFAGRHAPESHPGGDEPPDRAAAAPNVER